MTEVKMPEPACSVNPYEVNSIYWEAGHEQAGCGSNLFTEAQLKQYGDDRAREALEVAADTLEHGFVDDDGHHIQYAAEIRALAKEIK
jgi:hypothetical protein